MKYLDLPGFSDNHDQTVSHRSQSVPHTPKVVILWGRAHVVAFETGSFRRRLASHSLAVGILAVEGVSDMEQ